jgi:uncharacterized protein YcbX
LHLTAPDGSSAVVRFADFAPVDAPTEVWGNHFTARIAPDEINRGSAVSSPATCSCAGWA